MLEEYGPVTGHKWEVYPGTIAGMDRGRIEEYVSLFDATKRQVVTGTMPWEELDVWDATYWKTLPCGHRLSFDLFEYEESYSYERWHHGGQQRLDRYCKLQKWYSVPKF